MNKRILCFLGAVILSVTSASFALAQDTTTTTTQTTVTKTVQNPDGTYTIIQYPVGQDVTVDLTPTTVIPGAKGVAHVIRSGNVSTIKLDLSGLTGDAASYNVYTVDTMGHVTMLGPVAINEGVATQSFTTPSDRFMLFLSPESDLTAYGPETNVILRSAVPQGFAVIPYASSGEHDGAPVGEKVAATTTGGGAPAYRAPLLGISGFRRGTDTEMKINFAGAMTGTRANVYIEPRKDGPTQIKMRFHELKEAPAGKVYSLWAVSPENKFVKLGQIVNTGQRNEAQIQTETSLSDFGLFITLQDEGNDPGGPIVGTIIR